MCIHEPSFVTFNQTLTQYTKNLEEYCQKKDRGAIFDVDDQTNQLNNLAFNTSRKIDNIAEVQFIKKPTQFNKNEKELVEKYNKFVKKAVFRNHVHGFASFVNYIWKYIWGEIKFPLLDPRKYLITQEDIETAAPLEKEAIDKQTRATEALQQIVKDSTSGINDNSPIKIYEAMLPVATASPFVLLSTENSNIFKLLAHPDRTQSGKFELEAELKVLPGGVIRQGETTYANFTECITKQGLTSLPEAIKPPQPTREAPKLNVAIAEIQAKYPQSWCASKEEAHMLIQQAKSLDIAANYGLLYQEGDKVKMVSHSGINGSIQDKECLVSKLGDSISLTDLDNRTPAKDIRHNLTAQKEFANVEKLKKTYYVYDGNNIEEDIRSLINNTDELRDELLKGAYAVTVKEKEGIPHVYMHYFGDSRGIEQVELRWDTPLPEGVDLDKKISLLLARTTPEQLRSSTEYIKVQRKEELKTHVQELAQFFPINEEETRGIWALGELGNTGKFVLGVCTGFEDEPIIELHDFTINPLGQIILDNEPANPLANLDDLKNKFNATKNTQTDSIRARECERQVEQNPGFANAEYQVSALSILPHEPLAYVISPTGDLGQYTIERQGISTTFSTRRIPGRYVTEGDRNYESLGLLIATETNQPLNQPVKPWTQTELVKELMRERAEAERVAAEPPEEGGVGVALESIGNWIIGKIWGRTKTQAPPSNNVVAAVSEAHQAIEPAPQAPAAEVPAPAEAPPPAPAAAPEPKALVNLDKVLTNFRKLATNPKTKKLYGWVSQKGMDSQKAFFTKLNEWRKANVQLSNEQATEALKILLLNNNFKNEFENVIDVTALKPTDLPTEGIDEEERNAIINWLWR